MIKRFISILLAAVLLLGLAGCGKTPEKNGPTPAPNSTENEEKGSTLRLLYCANDTLNPYKTISKLNFELSSLMFDPLIKLDNSLGEVFVLAKSVKNEDSVCTVTLSNALFSDGTPLTAEDVIFSFNLARESERYSHLTAGVEKVEATEDGAVRFDLKKNDPYFYRLLGFPILKNGSDQLKNEDNVELVPIGTGRFVFGDKSKKLTANPKFFGEKPSVTEITLINAPDGESMEHYVEVGATDIYYADGGDENIIRMSGQKTPVNLNNLVYLGINHDYGPLRSDDLRHIISSAISRKLIVSEAFYSNGVAATGFFHPEWSVTQGYQTLSDSANLKICVENLANIGYNRLNEEGYYENKSGKILELDLLVNRDSYTKLSAANLIKKQLGEAGIKINVKTSSSEQFVNALKNGQFQLYLGEIKLNRNMDISSLVLKGGSAAYGMPEASKKSENKKDEDDKKEEGSFDMPEEEEIPEDFDGETSYISVIEGYYKGENSVTDIASALLSSMPVIPLLYRSAVVFYSDEIENIGEVSCYDIFFSADKYKVKK